MAIALISIGMGLVQIAHFCYHNRLYFGSEEFFDLQKSQIVLFMCTFAICKSAIALILSTCKDNPTLSSIVALAVQFCFALIFTFLELYTKNIVKILTLLS